MMQLNERMAARGAARYENAEKHAFSMGYIDAQFFEDF